LQKGLPAPLPKTSIGEIKQSAAEFFVKNSAKIQLHLVWFSYKWKSPEKGDISMNPVKL